MKTWIKQNAPCNAIIIFLFRNALTMYINYVTMSIIDDTDYHPVVISSRVDSKDLLDQIQELGFEQESPDPSLQIQWCLSLDSSYSCRPSVQE